MHESKHEIDTQEVVNRAVTQEDLDNSEALVKAGAIVGDMYHFPLGVEDSYKGNVKSHKVPEKEVKAVPNVPIKDEGRMGNFHSKR